MTMNFTMSIEIDLVTHECMHLLLRSPKFMSSVLVYIDLSANTKKNWLGIGLATLKAVGLTIIDKYSKIEIVVCETKEDDGKKCIYSYFMLVVLSILVSCIC